MKDYQYRFTIANDPLYLESPELRAAWTIAERVHRDHSRKKIDPTIGYICHPIMVYDLMHHMGVTNPRVLGAALLHDVREMCPAYQANPLALQDDLKVEMERQGLTGLARMEAVAEMAAWVEQVTNPSTERLESKVAVQMHRATFMSHDAKLIKIADQTANLICHLLMEDGPKFTHTDAVRFAKKARDLVHAIAATDAYRGERQELDRWRKLFDDVHARNAELLRAKTPKAERNVRAGFLKQVGKILPAVNYIRADQEEDGALHSMHFKKKYHIPPELLKAHVDQNDALFGLPTYGGVVRVDLDEQGRVAGFMTWAAPKMPVSHYRNRMQEALTTFLQLHHHEVVSEPELHTITIENKSLPEGRYHRFEAPMDVAKFATLAETMDTIGKADVVELKRRARELAIDYYSIPTGGNNRA